MGDEFNKVFPILRTDDLPLRDDGLPVRLSILMSINNFRRGQLARSLECLCRQDWREFEVLVCDNGSPENLQKVFDIFHPFLNLRTVRLEASGYSACPSRGFRELIPMARGEIIAIMQPEVMLMPGVAFYLHDAHFNDWPNTHSYKVAHSQFSKEGLPRWIIPKVGFFNKAGFKMLDDIDWHSDLRNAEGLPDFMTHNAGFSHGSNLGFIRKLENPWWFVASAKRDAGIWKDMPLLKVHASIDQWMLSYRRINEYLDVCTRNLAGYHQWHHRGQQVADAPEVVPEPTHPSRKSWIPLHIDELREMCKSYGVEVSDDQGFDTLWGVLGDARELDGGAHHRSANPSSSPTPVLSDPEVEMSIRVRRIKESSNG